jgi:uncharacterized protein (DUF362 family)
MINRRVAMLKNREGLSKTIYQVMEYCGILQQIKNTTRIAIKPNFTYPYFKPGVTTNPEVIREIVKIIRNYSQNIAIVETDGGYGAWLTTEAFAGHKMYELKKEYGVEVINLCDEPKEFIEFKSGWKSYRLPLPSRLLKDTDIFISMPVPKIHCMTGLSLSYKNQWGCVPDIMRLRRHYIFDDAIVAINQALKPWVIADGTYFLDCNGPMEGTPVRMDLIIAATDCGSFDRYVSDMMGYSWNRIGHLKRAVALGDMPPRLEDIKYNVSPLEAGSRVFHLKRTFRNRIALVGFKSRLITWLGYESWFGRVILHAILYAICGKPVKRKSGAED